MNTWPSRFPFPYHWSEPVPTKPTGRPRGRPKGAKNVPRPETFILESVRQKPDIPPPPEPEKRKVGGIWSRLSPEERSAYAKKLVEARRAKGTVTGGGRKRGVPSNMSAAQWEALQERERSVVQKIIKKMKDQGQLPDDPRAVEAIEATLVLLRTAQQEKDRLAAARLVLDFTKAKPTAKIEHTVKTAEDYLDELADED